MMPVCYNPLTRESTTTIVNQIFFANVPLALLLFTRMKSEVRKFNAANKVPIINE